MKIYDATHPLSGGGYTYPGDPEIVFEPKKIGGIRITGIGMGSHSGTHIDAPLHYLPDGQSIDQIPPDLCIGPCLLMDISKGPLSGDITAAPLAGTSRLILRSGWSPGDPDDYGYLTEEGARFLVERGISVIGTDAPSIESPEGDGSVHRILLRAGVVIIELLRLDAIPEGVYMMIALPLPLTGVDGSPARVILIDSRDVIL
ncbi:MAG: Kynurenine formamidase [Methanomicrobiales archaeon 53_19]|jgi:arylformamidase|uniref:cyclase family protein n=1 Tax=Methanocalculus sp. TaxID=2004547 RepID=UPI000746744A|nr:cyclase family protein [Methanocalculus sp.]KUK71150.1 MAG: Kynurenine formamidase [Methanocalculus sp. 52_23]KUL05010.1 MAG: Kynurenine formamidase [Methanomicrobiales archaeon 53_19]HIJ05984.1 cyclase family protein [Methanocalculus sp.]